MEEEIELKFENYIEDYDIDVNELSEKIQQKIERINELCDDYEQLDGDDDNEEEGDELLLQIQAMDDGICRDLEPIIEKIAQEQEQEHSRQIENNQKLNQGGQIKQNETDSNSPSWRFWM